MYAHAFSVMQFSSWCCRQFRVRCNCQSVFELLYVRFFSFFFFFFLHIYDYIFLFALHLFHVSHTALNLTYNNNNNNFRPLKADRCEQRRYTILYICRMYGCYRRIEANDMLCCRTYNTDIFDDCAPVSDWFVSVSKTMVGEWIRFRVQVRSLQTFNSQRKLKRFRRIDPSGIFFLLLFQIIVIAETRPGLYLFGTMNTE